MGKLKESLNENKKFLLLAAGLLVISSLIFVFLNTGLITPSSTLFQEEKSYKKPGNVIEEGKDYKIVISTTYGDIYIDLYEDRAPENVNSLLFLIGERYYEGLTFHRVIKNFLVQTGDRKGDGSGYPGYTVKLENLESFSDYDVGMANASQFFVVLPGFDRERIDGEYSLVGRVTGGFVVLESIEKAEVDRNYRPVNDVVVKSTQIHEK